MSEVRQDGSTAKPRTFASMSLVNKMVMVERKELAAYIAENCTKEFVKKDEAYLKLYTRQGRADILTFIKLYDLFYLTTFQIYRHES